MLAKIWSISSGLEFAAMWIWKSRRMSGRAADCAADVSGLFGQIIIPPWAGQLCRLDDGTAGDVPADDRPSEVVADEIAAATPEQHECDGSSPPDPDEGLHEPAWPTCNPAGPMVSTGAPGLPLNTRCRGFAFLVND